MTDGREIIRGIIPRRGHATEGGEERERGKTGEHMGRMMVICSN